MQEAGIQIGKFDHDLARILLDMNRHFIYYQSGTGIKISELVPASGGDATRLILKGTYHRHPLPDEHIYTFTRKDNTYWPQLPATFNQSTMTWECKVSIEPKGQFYVYIARVSEDIVALINFYYQLGCMFDKWLGREWTRLPKGVQILGEIAFKHK